MDTNCRSVNSQCLAACRLANSKQLQYLTYATRFQIEINLLLFPLHYHRLLFALRCHCISCLAQKKRTMNNVEHKQATANYSSLFNWVIEWRTYSTRVCIRKGTCFMTVQIHIHATWSTKRCHSQKSLFKVRYTVYLKSYDIK